jgi:hypothetical protein
MIDILTPEQIESYGRLRGYAGGAQAPGGHQGHGGHGQLNWQVGPQGQPRR